MGLKEQRVGLEGIEVLQALPRPEARPLRVVVGEDNSPARKEARVRDLGEARRHLAKPPGLREGDGVAHAPAPRLDARGRRPGGHGRDGRVPR